MEGDTIAAISTAIGEGGIAVIRVSGPTAIPIVDQIYKGRNSLATVDSHTVHYGYIIDPVSDEHIDEVLVTVMRSPRTFTREDVVEISCHGGIIPVQGILETLLSNGARIAEPGEFTKRAFLNGRIDLSQAEAVIDLIRSKTDRAAKIAIQQAEGRLARLIKRIRNEILEILAHLAVNVDYPEYDAEQLTKDVTLEKCHWIKKEVDRLLETAKQGKIYREGIATAIIGRPNVGKSSLLNTLVQENKAIVTDIPGTTRDVIEEFVNVRGIPLRLIDTAGIRETEDVVEKIGVQKSYKALEQADLVLLLLNYGEALQPEDLYLLDTLVNQTAIVILNKMDLPGHLNLEEVQRRIGQVPQIHMSLKDEVGLEQLEESIEKLFRLGKVDVSNEVYVSNTRHIHLLKQAKGSIEDVITGLKGDIPLDMIEIDLKNGWQFLGEVVGDAVSEDLIDQIFSKFCLGK